MEKQTYTNQQRMYLERDLVKLVAVALLFIALATLGAGLIFHSPATFGDFMADNYSEWIGLFADAVLLWILNWIIKRQEQERIITQLASESNAFALDAVKQVQQRGWLVDGTLRDRDLENANLRGANLREADLSYSFLNNACLSEARLFGADLSGADLMAADLSGAELRSVNLRHANLRWANLENAVLDGANLNGADLRFANTKGVSFEHSITRDTLIGSPLGPQEVARVQESFEYLLRDFDGFTKWFYFRLFHLAPETKKLFLGNMHQQRKKFMQTLTLLVEGLKNTNKIIPVLQMLGKRHLGYGVKEEHYHLVGNALIWAMQKQLGHAFTQEVKSAWISTFEMITMIMLDATRETGIT